MGAVRPEDEAGPFLIWAGFLAAAVGGTKKLFPGELPLVDPLDDELPPRLAGALARGADHAPARLDADLDFALSASSCRVMSSRCFIRSAVS